MRQIILDIETTGLYINDKHRIIEICCLEILNRKISGKKFHTYLNPQRKIDISASKITGIKDYFLIDKPFFKDVVEELLDFILGSEIIVHNAKFDINFINYELCLINHKIKDIKKHIVIFDTLIYSRKIYPGKKNNLDILAKRCKINIDRKYHGALLDVIILAKIYFIMTMMQIDLFLFDNNNYNSFYKFINENEIIIVKRYSNFYEKMEHVKFLKILKKNY